MHSCKTIPKSLAMSTQPTSKRLVKDLQPNQQAALIKMYSTASYNRVQRILPIKRNRQVLTCFFQETRRAPPKSKRNQMYSCKTIPNAMSTQPTSKRSVKELYHGSDFHHSEHICRSGCSIQRLWMGHLVVVAGLSVFATVDCAHPGHIAMMHHKTFLSLSKEENLSAFGHVQYGRRVLSQLHGTTSESCSVVQESSPGIKSGPLEAENIFKGMLLFFNLNWSVCHLVGSFCQWGLSHRPQCTQYTPSRPPVSPILLGCSNHD